MGYGFGFYSRSLLLFPGFGWGKNVVANRSSMDIENKKKYILVSGEGPTQGLNNVTITEEAKDHKDNFSL